MHRPLCALAAFILLSLAAAREVAAGPGIVLRQGGNVINSGGTYDFGSELKTVVFEIENTGDAPLLLNGALPRVTAGSPWTVNKKRILATGSYHTCVIAEGGLLCWGVDYGGETGGAHGGYAIAASSGVSAVAAKDTYTCVTQNGGVKCFGEDYYGRLGGGSIATYIVGLTSGVTDVSAGYYHACAVQDGGLKCWGLNNHGQTAGSDPTTYIAGMGAGSGVTAVSAGWYDTCAIQNGGLKCWGQLGSTLGGSPVPGFESGVSDVTVGEDYICAVRYGDISCWGPASPQGGGWTAGDWSWDDLTTPVILISAGPNGSFYALRANDSYGYLASTDPEDGFGQGAGGLPTGGISNASHGDRYIALIKDGGLWVNGQMSQTSAQGTFYNSEEFLAPTNNLTSIPSQLNPGEKAHFALSLDAVAPQSIGGSITIPNNANGTYTINLGAAMGGSGCTEPLACNYNVYATDDDGSCDLSCSGCTNPLACNYDPAKTIDDGSCDLSCSGCTNPLACNYDPSKSIDDGSCDLSCHGCTNPLACNYNASKTIDDGSCDLSCHGCTNPLACNYDPSKSIDDGTCDLSCHGCINPLACNYDPSKSIDDGSCDLSCHGCTNPLACNYNASKTIDDGSCDLSCHGCTNPLACNYDPSKSIDDGSCDLSCSGCTNPLACNYDPSKSIDDGSCDLSCSGCTNPLACNYDPAKTIDDGSCDLISCIHDISGTVSYGGQGLAGIPVTLSGVGTATTDGAGYFEFTDVRTGNYTLTVSKCGMVEETASFALSSDLTRNLPLTATVANSIVWEGAAADENWDSAANWNLGRLPNAGDNVIVGGCSNKNVHVPVNVTAQANTLTVLPDYGGTISGTISVTSVPNGDNDLSLADTVEIDGALVLPSGTFKSPRTLVVNGSLTQNGGTFDAQDGTVILKGGSGSQVVSLPGAALNNVMLAPSDCGGGTQTRQFSVGSIEGQLSVQTDNCGLTVTSSTGTLAIGGGLNASGNSPAEVNLGDGIDSLSLSVTGDFVVLDPNVKVNADVTLTGAGNTTLNVSGTQLRQGDWTLGKDPGTSVTLAADVSLPGNLVIDSGTLDAGVNSINLKGIWKGIAGGFAPGSGTVFLTGTNQDIRGSTTFNNLQKNATTSSQMMFQSGATVQVDGVLNLTGQEVDGTPQILTMRPLSFVPYVYLKAMGPVNLSFLKPYYIKSTGTTALTCTNCQPAVNSPGWSISANGSSAPASALDEGAPRYTLSGSVTHLGAGLPGVTVDAGPAIGTTLTDAAGNYSFPGIDSGTSYTLTLSKTGFSFFPEDVMSGLMTSNKIYLFSSKLEQYNVSGMVTDLGQPVHNALVDAGEYIGQTVTDKTGRFAFLRVNYGTPYRIAAAKEGFTFLPSEFEGTVTGPVSIEFLNERASSADPDTPTPTPPPTWTAVPTSTATHSPTPVPAAARVTG